MAPDVFRTRCRACGRTVDIHSVSEFHNVGGFRGYSYAIECECGVISHHDGNDGALIPDSLKHAAAVRHRAFSILGKVDYERRELTSSNAKSALKDARLQVPKLQDDGSWLVYSVPDRWSVCYDPDAKTYTLIASDGMQAFADVGALAANLPVG